MENIRAGNRLAAKMAHNSRSISHFQKESSARPKVNAPASSANSVMSRANLFVSLSNFKRSCSLGRAAPLIAFITFSVLFCAVDKNGQYYALSPLSRGYFADLPRLNIAIEEITGESEQCSRKSTKPY
jgi:hypothetical protein